jgi:membrane protein YdbS with pleckstrin-like domain
VSSGDVLRDPVERVSPRAPLMWLLTEAIEGVVVTGGVAALVWWRDWSWWIAVAVGVISVVAVVVVPRWQYAVHRWEVTAEAVYTQTGWWTRERRIAPMSRIQTVDYSQGAVERLFGLSTVTITTASSAGALEIAGLDAGLAQRLAEDLTHRAHARPGDAT